MESLLEREEMFRRTMVLFFIVDTSGSMEGSKIGSVNTSIREVLPEIQDMSDDNNDAEIKIAALEFSSGVKWITASGPVEAGKFHWNDLDAAGTTDLGAACRALNEKLSTKTFMKDATSSYAPAMFLITDGDPTDDWQKGLDLLKQNNWFKNGIRVALAIGEDANKDVLVAFTGSKETVLEAHNSKMLMKIIKFVSVRASQVASKNSPAADPSQGDLGDQAKQDELGKEMQDFKDDIASDPDNSVDEY